MEESHRPCPLLRSGSACKFGLYDPATGARGLIHLHSRLCPSFAGESARRMNSQESRRAFLATKDKLADTESRWSKCLLPVSPPRSSWSEVITGRRSH